MPINWPPATAPTWPPPGFTNLSFSGISAAQEFADQVGWTYRDPDATEQAAYFADALCDDEHTVTGFMLVTDLGTAYPFARCTGPEELRAFLMLWGPDYTQPEY